jgi:hypothetical protein
MQACGCGEDQIPWMLARFGLVGTAVLVFGGLVVMILVGWVLGWGVWLLRRRGEGAEPAEHRGLAVFSWREDEP